MTSERERHRERERYVEYKKKIVELIIIYSIAQRNEIYTCYIESNQQQQNVQISMKKKKKKKAAKATRIKKNK